MSEWFLFWQKKLSPFVCMLWVPEHYYCSCLFKGSLVKITKRGPLKAFASVTLVETNTLRSEHIYSYHKLTWNYELQTTINDKNSCRGEKTLKIIASMDGLDFCCCCCCFLFLGVFWWISPGGAFRTLFKSNKWKKIIQVLPDPAHEIATGRKV